MLQFSNCTDSFRELFAFGIDCLYGFFGIGFGFWEVFLFSLALGVVVNGLALSVVYGAMKAASKWMSATFFS